MRCTDSRADHTAVDSGSMLRDPPSRTLNPCHRLWRQVAVAKVEFVLTANSAVGTPARRHTSLQTSSAGLMLLAHEVAQLLRCAVHSNVCGGAACSAVPL